MNKKSQLKIQQMSFMLLAVALFFILVALFYLAVQYRNLSSQAGELEKDKAVLMSRFISNSQEFSCSAELGSYCIDTDKLMVLRNKTAYNDFWPAAYIKIRKIADKDVICNTANYPDCTIFEIYNKGSESSGSIGSFIALCRHDEKAGYPVNICELGRIAIGYELKT